MKRKVLITGASGFVGYHLITEALANDMEVYAAVRKNSRVDHLKEFDVQYVYPNYSNVEELTKHLSEYQYDYIIHGAGVTRARSVDEYNTINADYTYNLGRAAVASGSVKKFVLISSLAGIGPLDDLNGVITEDTTPKPVTAYGESKMLAEKKLKTIAGLNYTILRPTAVYGPRDTGIFVFFQQLTKGIEPYIGRINQKLSFIYVVDLAKVAMLALNKGDGKTYNISDDSFYDRYELGRLTKTILNLKPFKIHLPVNFVRLIATVAEKISSLRNEAPILNREKLRELGAINWNCSIDAAKKDLDFQPQYDLQKGMQETLKWYKANKWL
jgi:UDP-glucose 4-epimerase